MQVKTVTGAVTGIDDAQGIIDAVFAVFGVLDLQNDIAHPGMFRRTFRERGRKVRILDNHKADSILSVLGKPLVLRELTRNELPGEILAEHPEATGGAFASIKFLLDTPEGQGAYTRLASKAITEWSWGYDAIKCDYSETRRNGKKVTARNLRDVTLYEISPCLWGAQPASMTVGAKSYRRRGDLDRVIELEILRQDLERLEWGGKTRTQRLAEIYREQDELARL